MKKRSNVPKWHHSGHSRSRADRAGLQIARKALGRVRSITTDNGYEFLDPEKIKAVVGCNVYRY